MSDLKFECPHCKQSLESDEDLLGQVIECPACNGSIQLPAPQLQNATDTMIQQANVKDTQVDQKKACEICGKNLTKWNHAWFTNKCSQCAKGRSPEAKRLKETAKGFDKTRKEFRDLGYTVVILGLISFMFVGDASEELIAATLAGIVFCALTGTWLVARPSIGIGVAAGISLAVLGIIDLFLAVEETGGGFALLAPLIDFVFSIKVFVGCRVYADALRTKDKAEQRHRQRR
jgi:Zn finger protein HypA/HybF involved in hydrogenase expression